MEEPGRQLIADIPLWSFAPSPFIFLISKLKLLIHKYPCSKTITFSCGDSMEYKQNLISHTERWGFFI